MASDGTLTRLKHFRELRGLAAAELAKSAGVSRQTIYAIEDGSYVPNTSVALRLARALDARVDELFQLPDERAPENQSCRATLLEDWNEHNGRMTRVCRVGDRLVAVPQVPRRAYLPAANGWITDASTGRSAGQKISLETDAVRQEQQLVIAGCDPALSILERLLYQSGVDAVIVPCSSRQALRWLQQGYVHAAGSHLVDRRSGDYNLGALREIFPGETMYAAGFARWEQGLIVGRGNPKAIRAVADLASAGISIVNREKGSGSRQLLDGRLRASGVEAKTIVGYGRIASGHLAAARRVAAGKADCCIASRPAAAVFGLEFLSLQEEQFELCFGSATMAHPATRLLLDILNGAAMRTALGHFPGYETAKTGTLRHT